MAPMKYWRNINIRHLSLLSLPRALDSVCEKTSQLQALKFVMVPLIRGPCVKNEIIDSVKNSVF